MRTGEIWLGKNEGWINSWGKVTWYYIIVIVVLPSSRKITPPFLVPEKFNIQNILTYVYSSPLV